MSKGNAMNCLFLHIVTIYAYEQTQNLVHFSNLKWKSRDIPALSSVLDAQSALLNILTQPYVLFAVLIDFS